MNTQAQNRETLIREIKYRKGQRGLKELNLTFAKVDDALLQAQDDVTLTLLCDLFLRAPDYPLLEWLLGDKPVDPQFDNAAFALLQKIQRQAA